jgi:pimeloyl-ACP methyl ester carboxylesterase
MRYLVCLLGLILALPILAILSLALGLPITVSGIGYLLGSALAIAGLILFPWAGKNSLWLTMIGVVLMAFIVGARLILSTTETTANIRMITLPENKKTQWINTLIDEQDMLILGEALFHLIGGDSPTEHQNLAVALRKDYAEIKAVQGVFPSPILSTYLNLQRADGFDAVIIKPETDHRAEFALVFLHGYMGNVTAQCWEIAQAVKRFGAATICPSTDWRGDWWQPEGQRILQATFEYLRGQEIQNFYLGGFSNGGISIGRFASNLKDEKGLIGLILSDGFDNGAGIKELGVPVLMLQGAQDERIPASYARQFAEEIGGLGTYVEMDGDHFLIMKQSRQVQNALAKWLETQESRRQAAGR